MLSVVKKTILAVAILMLAAPGAAQAARAVHYLQCADCHRSGLSLYALTGGLCLSCHASTSPPVTLNDSTSASPVGKFEGVDASNAMGSHPNYNAATAQQTSHMWAVMSEANPAAGAQSPTLYAAQFDGRYNISRGKLICNRCHNPHGTDTYDTKLLKLDNSRDQMCRDCHLPWATSEPNAYESHPLVADYDTAADPAKFNTLYNAATGLLDANVGQGEVRLLYNSVSGKYMVSCTSCHGVHFTDSDAATADGKINYNSLAVGDGKLLRSDGYRDPGGLTNAQLAQKRSNLCQACHTYQVHGKAGGEEIGCLDCHSGHSYNGGNPNYFVLRGQATTVTFNSVTGLVYNALTVADGGGKQVYQVWADSNAGTANGYCEKCHGNLPSMPLSIRSHSEGEDCRTCHAHNKAGTTRSFEATGCDGCHGYPPRTLTQGGPDGYAFDSANGYDYSAQTFYKQETTTPHKTHAGGSGDYSFPCANCHANNNHDTGTFQDVFIAPYATLASGGGNLSPSYNPAGSIGPNKGLCSNVYCHSNGGARTSDTTRNYVAATNVPAWQNGATTGAIATCDVCHGNTAGTMATNSNSAIHQRHLGAGPQGKTYNCKTCHVNTASSSTALAAGAVGTTHVNNTVDVAFDTSYNLGGGLLTYNSALYTTGYQSTGGNCTAYCHSNGNGSMTNIPDWDAAATGSCTVCHNHDTTDTPMATGSHAAHINDSDNEVGRNLGCVECHSNTVSDNTTISNANNHVDGAKTLGISRDGNKTTCSNISCHSNGNFDDTVTYVDPTWGTSLGCDGCHGGGGVAYPNYVNGGTSNNANSHAAHIAKGYECQECHSGTATGSALKTGGTLLHVDQTVEISGAQIGSYTDATNTCNTVACHGGGSPQWGSTSLACADCHMGSSPDSDNFTYNDGTTAAINDAEWTYSGHGMGSVGLAGANVCLYCHDETVGHGAANYFRLRDNAAQGFADLNGVCLGCHGTTGSGVDPDGAAGGYASKTASLKIDKYHAGAKHVSDMGGQWCWDCHDPHGDASAADPNRIKMIQRNAASNSDANGVPVGGLTTTDIVFTDNTIGAGAGGFARDIAGAAAAEGVCNNCHTTTAQYTQTTGKGTHGTGKCTTCHKHSEDTAYDRYAFKGSGCNGCHGDNDGVGAGVQGQFWPDGEPASPAYADNQAGAHAAHVLAIGQELGYGDYNVSMYSDADQQTICAFCHPNPGAAGHDTDVNVTGSDASRVDVFRDGDDGAGNADVFRKWGPLANDYASDVDGTVGNQAYSYVSSNCSNLACHNRTSTPADWNTPPAGSDCSVCHGGSGSASGRHDTHVTGKGYACTECHVDNGVFPTATSGLAHADGAVNLDWSGGFENTSGDGSVTYGGALIFDDGNFGTCASAACHWDANTPAFDAAPVGAPNCAVCHGTPASGKHVEHVANTTYVSGSCGGCHGAGADAGTHAGHVNGSLDEIVTYVSGTQTCTNTCHIADTAGDWTAVGALGCADCHDADNVGAQPDGTYSLDQNAYPPVSAKHTAHLANNVYVPNDCADCHGAGADTGVHGSHKNGSVDNTLSYASATQTCTNSCHTADTVGDWTAGGALLCTDCHTSGLIGTAPGSGLHATINVLAHDDNFDAGYTCTDCHASGGPSADHKTGVLQDSTQTGYTFNPANIASYAQAGGCAADCHGDAAANGGTGKWSRKWIGATDAPLAGNPGDAVCDNCHNDGINSGTGLPDNSWNGGVSPAHGTDFDGDATVNEVLSPLSNHGTCQSCHGWGSGNYTIGTMHRDGTLQMNGPDVTPGPATGAEYDDVNHGCLAACHTGSFAVGSGDPNESHTLADSGWTVGYGDFGSGDCDTCHASNGRNHTGATTENSGLHATHVASGYVTSCTACHPHDGISVPPGTGVHNVGDNTVNFGGTYMGTTNNYTGADFGGTCAAANGCHNSSAGDWKTGTLTGTCADCHAATGKLLDQGAYPPTSAKHTKHIDNNAYVTGDCADCHGAGAATGAHAGHRQNNGIDNTVSYASATQTCTIACHAVTTGDWTAGGSVVCADCHTGTYVGPNSSSGLHATTNVMAHDGNFDAGYDCYSCHQATPSATHIQGGAAQDSTQTTYNFNGANIASYTQAGGCAANCHSDKNANGGTTGKWSRKWIGVTDALLTGANPGDAVCDNCHNDGINSGTSLPDDTWNGGVSPAHGTDFDGDATANEVLSPLSNHGTCQSCHGWGSGNYTIGTMHRDGTLQMNGPDATPGPATGAQYDDVNHGCLAACHTGSFANGSGDPNENHTLTDSGWTVGYGDFGSGDCNTCHASNGRDHGNATTESADTHSLHTTSEYITACTQCHPHDGLSVSPGTGIHADGTVNFNNILMPNTYDYTGADFGGGTFGNCSTNTCHDTDDGTNEWSTVSLGGDSCTDCHDSGKAGIFTLVSLSGSTATSGKHTLHLANTNVIGDCSECHGVGYGALSSVSPFTNHITTAVEVGDQLSAYTAPDCTTNCHDMAGADEVAISGDEPSWPTADTDTLGCADCHNKAGNTLSAPVHAGLSTSSGPATGKHGQHVGADPDYVGASPCVSCHTHQGALAGGSNGHVNGVNATLDASITWTSPTCTNACHVTAAGRDWTTGTLNCIDCHTTAKTLGAGGDAGMNGTTAPGSGRHSAHMSNVTYVGGGCTDCHGHNGVLSGGANGHVNGPAKTDITVASQVGSYDAASTQTCVNSCHAVVDGRDWTAGTPANGTVLVCADCHAATGKSLDQGGFPPVSNKHGQHLGSNALPATDQNECYACHDGTADNTGTLKIANHANGGAAVAFNSGFNYEGTAASRAGSGTTTTCSNVKCHTGSTTPTWDAASAVGCSSCHNTGGTGPLPSGTTAGSHAKHANNDAVYTDCANCHGNAASYTATGGHADHQNLAVNVAFSASVDPGADNAYTDGDGAAGVNYGGDFTDNGSCSSVDCHFNSATPAWGTAGGTTCTSCHNDGLDSGLLTDAAPATGRHVLHVNSADADYVNDCESCHGTNANTGGHSGHSQLNGPDFNGVLTWTSPTCANACHATAAGRDWTIGNLVCTDCHSSTKSLDAGGGADLSATVGPHTAEHDAHLASNIYVPNDCQDCHGHSGALGSSATTGHLDGPATTNITVASQVSVYGGAALGTCTNTCHSVVDGRDWTSATTLNCADCHDASGKTLFRDRTSGSHPAHVVTATAPTASDYGRTGNADAANYDFGCGECHPAVMATSHLNGSSREVIAGVNYSGGAAGTCSQNNCHQSGTGGVPAFVPSWGTAFTGDICAKCHGNSPATGSHGAHVVGIHYDTIYSGTTGLATAGNINTSAHGNAATATTINCNVCHSATATSSANAANTVCAGCHSDTNSPATGNELATVTDKTVHVNGTANVAFAAVNVKSKAQIRDDITTVTELNSTWTRDPVGYKAAGAFDGANAALNTAVYNSTLSSCSTVACHNGYNATWGDVAVSCDSCHKELP